LVTEFAKDLVYDEHYKALSCQNFVFANQEYRLSRLQSSVDYAIVDSPILLSAIYAPEGYPSSFIDFCFDMFDCYDNMNYFIERNHIYNDIGRMQNEEEAKIIKEKIFNFLESRNIKYKILTAGDDVPEHIYYKDLWDKVII